MLNTPSNSLCTVKHAILWLLVAGMFPGLFKKEIRFQAHVQLCVLLEICYVKSGAT